MHPDSSPPHSNTTAFGRRVLAYGSALLLTLVVALAVMLWHDRTVRYRYGQESASALAHGIERELSGQLMSVERALGGVTADARQFSLLAPDSAKEMLALSIARIEARNVALRDVGFSATLPDSPGLRATGSDTARRNSHLRIGAPYQQTGIGWVLPVALPITGHGVDEPAWVVAALRVDFLERVAAGLDLGSDGIANIIHRDGAMVVRSRDQARWVGTQMQDTPLFRELLPRQHSGVFDLPSELDRTTRIAAYRLLPDYPLLVVAGIARDDALRGWGMFAITASVLGASLALLWGALLWVMLRARASQRQLVDSLQNSTEQLKQTRRIAGLGDWSWGIDSGLVTWSDEIFQIHGLAPQPGPFRLEKLPQRIHPDDTERRRADISELVASGEPMEIQYRILRADGAVRTVYARADWVDKTPGQRMVHGTQQDITELAETRERLRIAQDEYRFLFDHNPLPMWLFDAQTLQFLAVNETAIAKYGYSREEFLARSFLDIRPADDVDDVLACLATDPTDPTDAGSRSWRHTLKSGEIIFVDNALVEMDFGGRRAWLMLVQDITAQVHAQAERARSEQRFELVARATSDAVWDLDVTTGQLWWSDSFYQQFGYSREQLPATLAAWEELVHPDDASRVIASFDAATLDPAVSEWEAEYRFRQGDASYADVLDRGFLLRDQSGVAVRMVGGMLDLTQKHRYESDLRLLRRAVESTENGVVIADARLPDLPIVYVNTAFERITGYAADEVLGRNCRFLQGNDHEQIGRHEIQRGISHGHEARALLRNFRKDGALFWNDLHVNPVLDDAGTLTHYVGVLNDVTERQRYQEQIAHRATHDELTGLPNRTLLLDRLQQATAAAARSGNGVAVVFIDLDNFKLINDSLGHGAGDVALRAIASRLIACVRDADSVGRFGGDEFVLVLAEQADSQGVARVIERVEAAFAQPVEIGGALHYLSGSIGYCLYPQHGDDAQTLLMHADVAMYHAKQAGRNRVVEYRREFESVVSDRLHLISRLREALVREEFVLHFQPLYRGNGVATGLEALVRWQHPEQGLLPPGRFIEACESSGLIVPLGRWVFREAARHHGLLAAQGLGHLTISINVSALQFQPGLLDDVLAAMDGHNLPPGALEIELTESAVMADPEAAIAIMDRLNGLGISVAVDDFGTGYSSLAYLKRLPISRLKIDQSFVRDLGHDEDDEAICASIITLARCLDLRTVAEGVETEGQRGWLLAHGCDELQGYLLARPAPFDDILALLAVGSPADNLLT